MKTVDLVKSTLEKVDPMTVYPESIIWTMICYPDGRIEKLTSRVDKVFLPFSTVGIDYGADCFGGNFVRKTTDGKPYIFLGENHHNRLINSSQKMNIISADGSNGLPTEFIDFDEYQSICFDLKEQNEYVFGTDTFNYFRPSVQAIGMRFGVGNLKNRGFIFTIQCMSLTEGQYYDAEKGINLLVVDPNIVCRPSHKSEVSQVKGGRETYVKGAVAAAIAHEKGYTDALMSSYDRKAFDFVRLDCSSSCFCLVMDEKTIYMPNLKERALFGLTMQAVLKWLKAAGFNVEYVDITDEILKQAKFVMTAGTAAGLCLVYEIGWYNGNIHKYTDTSFFTYIYGIFKQKIGEGITYVPGLRNF